MCEVGISILFELTGLQDRLPDPQFLKVKVLSGLCGYPLGSELEVYRVREGDFFHLKHDRGSILVGAERPLDILEAHMPPLCCSERSYKGRHTFGEII
jgi:hypothetical protein